MHYDIFVILFVNDKRVFPYLVLFARDEECSHDNPTWLSCVNKRRVTTYQK